MADSDVQRLIEGISKLGLSRAEMTRIKTALQDPAVVKQVSVAFEDPLVASKLIKSFGDSRFVNNFFDDPIIAVRGVTRRA